MHTIHELLELAITQKASDLIIKAGAAPAIRIDGRIHLTQLPVVSPEATRELAYEIMFSSTRDTLLQYPNSQGDGVDLEDAEERMKLLEQKEELDMVSTIPNMARVRANLFMQRGTVGASLRIIPLHPYTVEELGLPANLKKIALEPQGLIIIT